MLTEAQVVALEKAKSEKEAHGEFESEHPGYCGAQDTFYVGNMKGVGRSNSGSLAMLTAIRRGTRPPFVCIEFLFSVVWLQQIGKPGWSILPRSPFEGAP